MDWSPLRLTRPTNGAHSAPYGGGWEERGCSGSWCGELVEGFLPDGFEGDLGDEGLVVAEAAVAEVGRVGGGRRLDDGVVAAVGADEGGVGGSEDGDDRAVEANGDVEGCGVVADQDGGVADGGHHLAYGGLGEEDAGVADEGLAQWGEVGLLLGRGEDDQVGAGGAGVEQALGDLDVAVDRPALAAPAGGGGDAGISGFGGGVEQVLVEPAIVVGIEVEPHVVLEGEAFGGEEGEHAVDGVDGGVDGVAVVVSEPGELAGGGETDAVWGAGESRQQAGAEQALEVEDQVVAGGGEAAGPGARFGGDAGVAPERNEALTRERDHVVQSGVVADGVGVRVVDEPVDASGGERVAERDEGGDGAADVAEGAGLDDQDARGGGGAAGGFGGGGVGGFDGGEGGHGAGFAVVCRGGAWAYDSDCGANSCGGREMEPVGGALKWGSGALRVLVCHLGMYGLLVVWFIGSPRLS